MIDINENYDSLSLELQNLRNEVEILKSQNNLLIAKLSQQSINFTDQVANDLHRAEEFAKFGNWNLYIDEQVIRASEGAKNIYGLDKNVNSVADIQAMALVEYRPMLDKALEDLLIHNIPYEIEFKIKRKSDGRIVDIYSKKEYDPIKKIAFGVIQDITEKKKAEYEILKFKRAVETSGEAIFLTDINGIITYINPEFTHLYGYTSDEVIGKVTPRILKSGKLKQENYEYFWQTILNKQVVKGELVNKTKDGKIITTEGSANPILGETGEIIGFLCVQRDISERKKIEEIYILQRNQFQTIMDSMPNFIFVKDIDGFFLMANKAFAQLFNLQPSDVLNKTDYELNLNSNNLPKYRKEDLEVFSTNQPKIINEELFLIDTNKRIYTQTIKLPYDYPGWNKPCILGITTDITDLKIAEEELLKVTESLERMNSQKDKFFSIIAHDLRGPLSGFLGLSKIIAEEYQNLTMREVQEYGITLQKSATNLYKLLENLLDWSRMQRGTISFQPEICSLNKVVNQNLSIFGELAKLKEITIEHNISPDSYVLADLQMLNATLRNLISNAIKFTHRNGSIEISQTYEENIDSDVVFIKDSGIGIDSDKMSKFFKLEAIESQPGTEGESSTGLGLLLCMDFVEKHNGKIWVESQVGIGSTFFFSLPRSKHS